MESPVEVADPGQEFRVGCMLGLCRPTLPVKGDLLGRVAVLRLSLVYLCIQPSQ